MVKIANITLGQILHTGSNQPLGTTDNGDGTYSLKMQQVGSKVAVTTRIIDAISVADGELSSPINLGLDGSENIVYINIVNDKPFILYVDTFNILGYDPDCAYPQGSPNTNISNNSAQGGQAFIYCPMANSTIIDDAAKVLSYANGYKTGQRIRIENSSGDASVGTFTASVTRVWSDK